MPNYFNLCSYTLLNDEIRVKNFSKLMRIQVACFERPMKTKLEKYNEIHKRFTKIIHTYIYIYYPFFLHLTFYPSDDKIYKDYIRIYIN